MENTKSSLARTTKNNYIRTLLAYRSLNKVICSWSIVSKTQDDILLIHLSYPLYSAGSAIAEWISAKWKFCEPNAVGPRSHAVATPTKQCPRKAALRKASLGIAKNLFFFNKCNLKIHQTMSHKYVRSCISRTLSIGMALLDIKVENIFNPSTLMKIGTDIWNNTKPNTPIFRKPFLQAYSFCHKFNTRSYVVVFKNAPPIIITLL